MSITTSLRRKAATAALVALTAGAGIVAQSSAAQARDGRKGAAAVGALAAIAGIALVAGAAQGNAEPLYGEPVYGERFYGERDLAQDEVSDFAPVQYRPPYAPRGEVYGVVEGRIPSPHGEQRRYAPERGYGHRQTVCRIKRQRVYDGYAWVVSPSVV